MAGKTWQVEAAGCPCTIRADKGEWVVVIAASIARGPDLAAAIWRAGGGLVEPAEARRLAESILVNGRGRATVADPLRRAARGV